MDASYLVASKEAQLAAARSSFVRDERDIDEAVAEFEATVWAILTGGINRYFHPYAP